MPQNGKQRTETAQHAHILVVDDELFIRSSLELYFEAHEFAVSTASSGDLALQLVESGEVLPDLVLLDLMMPGTSGMDVLVRLKEIDESIEVIIATGCGGMNTAVEALRHGAFDYITKPILDFDRDLLKTVERALEARRFKLESRSGTEVKTVVEDSRQPVENEPTDERGNWLGAYEAMNRLVADHPAGALAEEGMRSLWGLIRDDLGATAALVVQQDIEGEWNHRHHWGFVSPPRPRDLWQSEGPDSTNGEGEDSSRWVWDLSTRPVSARLSKKWSRVIQVPFRGESGEPLQLLLFYRDPHPFTGPGSPLALLGATLSWLYRSGSKMAYETSPVPLAPTHEG